MLFLAFVVGFVMQNPSVLDSPLFGRASAMEKSERIEAAEAVAEHTKGVPAGLPEPANVERKAGLGQARLEAVLLNPSEQPQPELATDPEKAAVVLDPREAGSRSGSEQCLPLLEITAGADAMLSVRFEAPCHQGAMTTFEHAGILASYTLGGGGGIAFEIPALRSPAEVMAILPGGLRVEGAVGVDDLAPHGRMILSLPATTKLELHAFEGKAAFGDAGHITEGHARMRVIGERGLSGGWQAIAYEAPMASAGMQDTKVEFSLLTRVERATCGRRVATEYAVKHSGAAEADFAMPLSLNMPGCGAVGSSAILPHSLPEMRFASPLAVREVASQK